jgi:hypothetical protein
LALTEFGLAKALDHASMRLTSKGGGFLGTLHYSSPEQALGGELTPASDLYSLGVTIYEALTGELPLAGKTTEALLQSILHGTPRRLRDSLKKPPRDLEAVVDKLLTREPGDRYQDGEELARDLQRIADGEPVHIRRLPLHVRLYRRMRKNPLLTGAIAAIVVLLLVTVVLVSVWRNERGQTIQLRHKGHLVEIAKTIASERAVPSGPTSLLESLTGVPSPAAAPSESILKAFDRAARDLPGDEQVAAMRVAYADDADPAATAFLAAGRGYEALRGLDRAIEIAAGARTGGELEVELRLHGLYLARGVANLTAAVARPNEARTDLALAHYLRPGASFPLALLDVLDVVQSGDFTTALARLEKDMASAAPERLAVLGALLWSAAALQPHERANLMDFGLSFPKRRALHELGLRWLRTAPEDPRRRGQPTGLSAILAAACRQVLDKLGEPDAASELAKRTADVVTSAVHPESPLQGWRIVLQMLLQPAGRSALVDRDQRPLPPTMQLAAWEDLLRLSPPRTTIKLWLPRFEELRRDHPSLPGISAIAARMHFLAGSPDAFRLAQEWIVEAEGDPEAQLCRMQVSLRSGSLVEARDDGIVAVQDSVDSRAAIAEVVRIWEEAAPSMASGAAQAARVMARQFHELLSDDAPAGGRR